MSALLAINFRRRALCPACSGFGGIQELRDGEGHEDPCWACHGHGTLLAAMGTLARGITVDPGSDLLLPALGD